MSSPQARLTSLLDHIRQGKILEAMSEFYDADVAMQENTHPPTRGRAANIEREKQFLAGIKEWKGFTVGAIAAGDETTMYECTFDFIATNGHPVHMEQVAVQRWKNGKIVHERYYYDTGAAKA